MVTGPREPEASRPGERERMLAESPVLLSSAGLTKRFPSFLLDRVSFELAVGTLLGFGGRSGAASRRR